MAPPVPKLHSRSTTWKRKNRRRLPGPVVQFISAEPVQFISAASYSAKHGFSSQDGNPFSPAFVTLHTRWASTIADSRGKLRNLKAQRKILGYEQQNHRHVSCRDRYGLGADWHLGNSRTFADACRRQRGDAVRLSADSGLIGMTVDCVNVVHYSLNAVSFCGESESGRLGRLCIQDVSTPIFFAFGIVGWEHRLGGFDGVDFVSLLSCEFAGGATVTGSRIQS